MLVQTKLESEIREQLTRYVIHEITLQEFQSWFASVLWEVEEPHNEMAEPLVYEITLRLAEYSNKHWSEWKLRNMLYSLARNFLTPSSVSTFACYQTENLAWASWPVSV